MSTLPNIDFEELENQTDSKKFLILSLALNQIQVMVSKFQEVLVTGSGSDLPLPERMRNVEAFVASWKYWTRIMVGAILVQTITFGAAAIVYAIRIFPVLDRLSRLP